MSEFELKRYYKEKAKKPALYGYDEDGNLIEKNREGTVIKTIPLPTYRPPTFEEYDDLLTKNIIFFVGNWFLIIIAIT